MHIPDGYLSPHAAAALYAAAVPLWVAAVACLRKRLRSRQTPLLAMLSAFSFLVMMFNIPLPGGTTAHAAGGVLIAILVGIGPALVAVTVALAIQALFFGDGGILALGANAVNLGFIMPAAGWLVFRALRGGSRPGERRFTAAAAAGGYVGINAAALAVSLELGLMPLLHRLPDGTPLYSPFPFAVIVPAMTIPHLAIGGVAEAILTGGVIAFLGSHHRELFEENDLTRGSGPGKKGEDA